MSLKVGVYPSFYNGGLKNGSLDRACCAMKEGLIDPDSVLMIDPDSVSASGSIETPQFHVLTHFQLPEH